MYEKINPSLRDVMQRAKKKATELRHEYIGTEHILLALCEAECNATSMIRAEAVPAENVIATVLKMTTPGPVMVTAGKLPQTPRAKRAFEYAIEEAKLLHHDHVGTEHMLLGLMREGEGVAAVVLNNYGFTLDQARVAAAQVAATGEVEVGDSFPSKAELEIAVTALRTNLQTAGDIIEKLNEWSCHIDLDVFYKQGSESVTLPRVNGELAAHVFLVDELLPLL